MTTGRKPTKAWRRGRVDSEDDRAAKVFRELQRRVMRDLETCRVAWEVGDDPLAVCAAVVHAGLPPWLTNAILVLLTEGEEYPPIRRRLWRERTRHAIDATRAAEIAAVRSHPEAQKRSNGGFKWDEALQLGEHFARQTYSDIPRVSPAGAKRSYQRVCRNLEEPGRYYRAPAGTAERIKQAWMHLESILTERLARERGRK